MVYSPNRKYAKGNIISYLHAVTDSVSRVYKLRAKTSTTVSATPIWYEWENTRPKWFMYSNSAAITENPNLMPDDKVFIWDKLKTVTNSFRTPMRFNDLILQWDSQYGLIKDCTIQHINLSKARRLFQEVEVRNHRLYAHPAQNYAISRSAFDYNKIVLNSFPVGSSVKIRYLIKDDFVSGGGEFYDNFPSTIIYVSNNTVFAVNDDNFDVNNSYTNYFNISEELITGDFFDIVIRNIRGSISVFKGGKNKTLTW